MTLTKKNSVNFTQCSDHVHFILKSGLILDEDMDCIFAYFNGDDENATERKLTFTKKLLSGISLTSLVIIIQQKYSLLYLPIAASPVLLVGIQSLRDMIYRKNQRRNMEVLINALRDISRMNRMICEYYKSRNNCDNSAIVNILNPYTRAMELLLELTFNEEVSLLNSLRGVARHFGEYIHSLKVDYEYMENIDFDQFTINNVNSINDSVIYLERLCDIFVLVVSSTLTCLAVTLCPNLSTTSNINVDEVLDSIIPRMKKMSVSCYTKINKKFDDVKYHHLNKSKIQEQSKPPPPNSTDKLHSSTCKVVACSSDILAKSQIVLEHLKKHDLQSMEEKIELSACIGELRTQAFDFYQALDVLYKVFEINVNRVRLPCAVKAETNSISSGDFDSVDSKVNDASFNFSEPSDDEEYELYIGADETNPEGNAQGFSDEEENRHLASVLSQELKQKLKNHSRFIAARKKRGITEQEPEAVPVLELAKRQPPKVEALYVTIPLPPPPNFEPGHKHPFVSPPPPPPLPDVNWGPGGDATPSSHVPNPLLDSIKAASKNRKCEEDVFGSDGSSDEED